jgi:hypothetical protein
VKEEKCLFNLLHELEQQDKNKNKFIAYIKDKHSN